MVHPLYDYGLPVINSGQPPGGTAAVTTGEVEPGTSTSPHTPPANSGTVTEPGGSPSDELTGMYTPVLTDITPNNAVVGGANFTMTAIGSNFIPKSVIVFNGGKEPTTYVSATEVTTGVQPSTAGGPATVPVEIDNLGFKSAPQDFHFNAA